MNVRRWLRGCALAYGVIAAASCSLRTRYAETASEPRLPLMDGSASQDAASVRDAAQARAETPPPRLGEAGTTLPEAGTSTPGDSGLPAANGCSKNLADRISVTHIDVDTDIGYRDATYDAFPMDARIGFTVARDGTAYIAWTDPNGAVRVTPLDAKLVRSAPDILVPGTDIGGMVVRDDGFALLTRRDDPGDPLTDPNSGSSTPVKAAFLVRYVGRREAFAAPLTGTKSITASTDPKARDCAPLYLYGRLAWNGVRYGAYFQVHGCSGDPHQSYYGDKLVYADDDGKYSVGGWSWNCSNNLGLRLLPEPGPFTAVCFADSQPAPGLNLVTEGVPTRQLSPEFTVANWTAAAFGSIAKVPADGSYALAWLSRGVVTSQGRIAAAKTQSDIAFMRLGSDYTPLGAKKWLVQTSDVSEVNLHLAPYGNDRMLMTWERIENPRCTDRTCWGPYSGTLARVIDLDGNPLSADASLATPPNTSEDLAVLPNGDIAWAFVADPDRSYENPVQRNARLPSRRQLSVARLRVCD